jgi:glycosyltransferase involved in cell wall biosynthesis
MKPKKILLITPYFAPQTHAAMFRVYKLAKYLPSHGYEVHVLTVDTNYLYNEDNSLLDQLPSEVTIHTAQYIEPTLRGIKMALGGADSTFAALKKKQNKQNPSLKPSAPQNTFKQQSIVSRLKLWFANRPDRFWTWQKPALKEAEKIIKQHDINVIYTTTAPFSTLSIGAALKHKLNIKWVADFRDPLGYSERFSAPSARVQIDEQRTVKQAMLDADHVVGLARSYEYIFSDLYQLESQRFSFIPTGADDAYIQGATHNHTSEKQAYSILFVGEFLDEYDSNHVFKALEQAALKLKRPLTLKVIGRQEVNQHRVQRLLNSAACHYLKNHCEFIDHMPQADLYKEIAKASACLLIPGNSLWWTNFAKLVDYIALRKRVIADVPDISEARYELNQAQVGVFLCGDIVSDTQQLMTVLESDKWQANSRYCDMYLASSQVKAFVKVFDRQLGLV